MSANVTGPFSTDLHLSRGDPGGARWQKEKENRETELNLFTVCFQHLVMQDKKEQGNNKWNLSV